MADSPLRCYFAMPHYDGRCFAGTARAWAGPFSTRGKFEQVHPREHGGSLLANVFNKLWCDARNNRLPAGLNRFAMIHSDVSPLNIGFLDIMEDEMNAKGADLCSVVIQMKDGRGLTSTGAWVKGGDCGARIRRLTMTEVFEQLPPTFDADDMHMAGIPGMLCVNTGLWLCKFNEKWIEDVLFSVSDQIVNKPDKCWPEVMSEDWRMSQQLFQMGKKVCATRKVTVQHFGITHWDNDRPCGTWKRDEEFFADEELGANTTEEYKAAPSITPKSDFTLPLE